MQKIPNSTDNANNLHKPQASVGLLVIGDEILSGRTPDQNINSIARALFQHGVNLTMVRIVGDVKEVIIDNLRELLRQCDYVLTTGGIGPTHDDITAEAVAAALNLPLELHADADRLLQKHYAELNLPYNDARRRMAKTPKGATLLPNVISIAPGFAINRVFVMAGVPKIMEIMLPYVLAEIPKGKRWWQESVETELGEGTIAKGLSELQNRYPEVMIGSYPKFQPTTKKLYVALVLKSLDQARGQACLKELNHLLQELVNTEPNLTIGSSG